MCLNDLEQNPLNVGKLKKMSEESPKFRVFAVKDGTASGLLIERQMSYDAPTEKKYFWLAASDGLAPTEEILKACDGIQEMLGGKCNRGFVDLLIRFITFVYKTGKLKIPITTVGQYFSGVKCQRIIDHFFERGDIELRDFFINASTFKGSVLTKVKGREELGGKAKEFRVLSPHEIVVIFSGYLKLINHILKVGEGKAKWFRKDGPIAADFDGGTVYTRRILLDKIKKMVFDNDFSLLEGESAVGKTVLVRQLGYELARDDGMAVYWFDGDLERGFDKDQLVNEINGLTGVFILENVHLEAPKFQRIYYRVNPDPNRYVLFTARPSFKDSQNKRDWLLSELNHISLEPFNDVDKIIACFVSQHTDLPWKLDALFSIKEVSSGSFWFLSYALEGYTKVRGRGEPSDWLEDGVRDDLRALERQERAFPEVLVAIAYLYRREVLMEESYLTKVLGFDLGAITDLVKQSEVTTQNIKGYTFYGLPHSGLADAYWRWGAKYARRKGLPPHKELIYSYAVSGAPNALEAVTRIDERLGINIVTVIRRLVREGFIADLFRREISLVNVGQCASLFRGDEWIDEEVLSIVAERICKTEDLFEAFIGYLLFSSSHRESGRVLWQMLNRKLIAERLNDLEDFNLLSTCLICIRRIDIDAEAEIKELLDKNVRSEYERLEAEEGWEL